MITPQTEHPELAKAISVSHLYFKREDLHPYGSHKGRSIPMMIDIKAAKGIKHFAISSSGNAALAAALYVQEKNAAGDSLSLSIFIGEHINPDKKKNLLSLIRDERITITETERPLQALFKTKQASLRQSRDPLALLGYETLAKELIDIPDLKDVFIGTSSGTTGEALAEFFISNKKNIAVHIVQPVGNSPIAKEFDKEKRKEEVSIADAIVDKVAYRKEALLGALREIGGYGWVVSNDEIREAQKLLLEKTGIEASPNGALGLAGLMRAASKGAKFKGAVVCIITGK